MASKFVIALFIGCLMTSANALKIISVTNGESQGEWGMLTGCPGDSRAIGYQTQNDMVNAPLYDKSAMNSIRLFCDDSQATNITSTISDKGTWQLRQNCAAGEALASFRMLVEAADSGPEDKTAVNSIQFTCTDGKTLNYNGNTVGTWGDNSETCDVTGICALQTRVLPITNLGDNTALNDVLFVCC